MEGFTLIELLVVIAIVAVLAAVVCAIVYGAYKLVVASGRAITAPAPAAPAAPATTKEVGSNKLSYLDQRAKSAS